MSLRVGGDYDPLDENSRTFEEREAELRVITEFKEKALKVERQSFFYDWLQLNREYTNDLLWLLTKYPNALAVLLFLFQHMDKYNAVVCSYKVMEENLGLSRSTLHRAVDVLKKHGFIHILKSGSSNIYIVSPNLVWSSWGNNKRFCQFPANIVLSASENEEYATETKDKQGEKITKE